MESEQLQRYVVCRVGQNLLGIAVDRVQEMVVLPSPAAVPLAPAYVRGTINLRGRLLIAVDLRTLLGLQRLADEMAGVVDLPRREQDHLGWVRELEASIQEGREFALGRNPHQCAFGKWYDHFQPSDPGLARIMTQFDTPHQKLHASAATALEHAAAGRAEECSMVLAHLRSQYLAPLRRLFAQAISAATNLDREVAVVLTEEVGCAALVTDAVLAVEDLAWVGGTAEAGLAAGATQHVDGFMRRPDDRQQIVLRLADTEGLLAN